ncbi:MAG: DNA/RNA non-specific endonuclease [Archangium sp.]
MRFVIPMLVLCACGSNVDMSLEGPGGDELISMMAPSPSTQLATLARQRDEVASVSGNRFGRVDPLVKPPRHDAGVAEEVDAGVAEEVDAGVAEEVDAGVWTPSGPLGASISPHLGLGIPDDSSVGRADRWLLVRPQFVTSYDTAHKVPNWSAWKLDSSFFGPATRATSFRTDPLLGSASQARDSDYVGSGFDRGHLCPSADRTLTDADNDSTFFLTNVVPQTHASNAGPWLTLEDECRDRANEGKKLLIIAGPIFASNPQTIGTGVSVPVSMFKVVIVSTGELDAATLDPAAVKVYATIMPNTSVVTGSWRQWQVRIDDVEAATGLDFFSDVNPSVQAVLEARVDL